MLVIIVALLYGMTMGLIVGYGMGRHRDEIKDLSEFEIPMFVLGVMFWHVTLILVLVMLKEK